MGKRPSFHPEIGQFFANLRDSKGWTQRQAADIAARRHLKHVTPNVLWRLEAGQIKNPEPSVLRDLADLYEMSYERVAGLYVQARYGFTSSDLLRHTGTPSSEVPPPTKGVADVPTSARVQQDRKIRVALAEEIQAIANRLAILKIAVLENRTPSGRKTTRRGRDRKAS